MRTAGVAIGWVVFRTIADALTSTILKKKNAKSKPLETIENPRGLLKQTV